MSNGEVDVDNNNDELGTLQSFFIAHALNFFITIKNDKNLFLFTPLRASSTKKYEKIVVKHSTIDLQLMEVKPTNPNYLVDILTLTEFVSRSLLVLFYAFMIALHTI